MKRQRDTQRRRVYEADVAARFKIPPDGRPFAATLEHCQDYVDFVLTSDWWTLRFMNTPAVRVLNGRGSSSARIDAFSLDKPIVVYMRLPKACRFPWMIVHELAHVAHNEVMRGLLAEHPDPVEEAHHGWRFCGIWLDLVEFAFGMTERKALRQQFQNRKVKYSRPRVVSQEVREASRKRMIELREGGIKGRRIVVTVLDDVLDEHAKRLAANVEATSEAFENVVRAAKDAGMAAGDLAQILREAKRGGWPPPDHPALRRSKR